MVRTQEEQYVESGTHTVCLVYSTLHTHIHVFDVFFPPCARSIGIEGVNFTRVHRMQKMIHSSTSHHLSLPAMKQLTAQQKHDILIHCQLRRMGESEVDIARLHGASVTRETIWRWRQRWDHTPHSLEHKVVSGRPRTLTPAETSRHIRAPILAANRQHRAISYPQLTDDIRSKTHKKISLRTVQRVGSEQLQIKSQHTTKRTREERESTYTCDEMNRCVCCV